MVATVIFTTINFAFNRPARFSWLFDAFRISDLQCRTEIAPVVVKPGIEAASFLHATVFAFQAVDEGCNLKVGAANVSLHVESSPGEQMTALLHLQPAHVITYWSRFASEDYSPLEALFLHVAVRHVGMGSQKNHLLARMMPYNFLYILFVLLIRPVASMPRHMCNDGCR